MRARNERWSKAPIVYTKTSSRSNTLLLYSGVGAVMAARIMMSCSSSSSRDEVYVAAIPLRASKGPAQLLLSTAYSLNFPDLQHLMVIHKPNTCSPTPTPIQQLVSHLSLSLSLYPSFSLSRVATSEGGYSV